MGVKVLDSSAVAAILFGESEAASIVAALQQDSLITCALLPFEVANVCLRKIRRYPAQRREIISAYECLAQMELEILDVDMDQAISLADRTGLTAYDAAYLFLALSCSAGLVTLDSRLLRAYQSLL